MINQISKFIGKFMGLVFGPENHTNHIELDKPIELRESNQSNQIKIESIKALKEIESFNHDSLKKPMPKHPVPISEPIKDEVKVDKIAEIFSKNGIEPIKNEHVQEVIKQESKPETKKPLTWTELKRDKDKK
jgi:hypothetical protein